MILPDLLKENLEIVFCGTAVSTKSKEVRAYYGNPTNKFWITLFESDLTPSLLKPHEYPKLLELNIGLTDLVKDQYGQDASLKFQTTHALNLHKKIERFAPKLLAFTSKTAALQFLRHIPELKPQASRLQWGLQSYTLGRTAITVLPSTSGLATASFKKNCVHWLSLKKILSRL